MFDFPNSPTNGQQAIGPGGLIYVWDGTKWIGQGVPPISGGGGTIDLSPYATLASPTFTGDPKGPTPATSDSDTSLATTAFTQAAIGSATGAFIPSLNNSGRNYLDNYSFRVNQRGLGTWSTNSAMMSDRWRLYLNTDVVSASVGNISDADRAAIGDEEAGPALQCTFTGNAGATAFSAFYQAVEYVYRLSNKTVTVSFWAKANSGTPKVGVSFDQYFGSGGSPSAVVPVNGQSVTISTTWTRYSLTFTLPSYAGKTLGTNGDSTTNVIFWLSASTNQNTRSGGVGVQSGTVSFWGMQLELGSTASAIDKVDRSVELVKCQRHYLVFQAFAVGYSAAPGNIYGTYALPTLMRAQPSSAISGQSYSNASAFTLYNSSAAGIVCQAAITATGVGAAAATVALSAEI